MPLKPETFFPTKKENYLMVGNQLCQLGHKPEISVQIYVHISEKKT